MLIVILTIVKIVSDIIDRRVKRIQANNTGPRGQPNLPATIGQGMINNIQ
jgi:hypothetical protein